MRNILIILFMLLGRADAFAQHERTHSTMAGAGWSSIYDTYLSPYAYHGTNVHLMRETERPLLRPLIPIKDLTLQTLLDVDASFVNSPARNVDEYAGGVRYSVAGLYRLPLFLPESNAAKKWEVCVGPQLSSYIGGIYNNRNGNNPAQAKLDLMVDLSAQAKLHFRMLKRDCTARYQFAIPLFGLAFSPNYGQSYYEAFSLEKRDHNVVFAHFGNMPSMRHLLTLDMPIQRGSRTCVRIGYAGEFMQSTFNNLRYHSYTHSFMIGITQTFNRL